MEGSEALRDGILRNAPPADPRTIVDIFGIRRLALELADLPTDSLPATGTPDYTRYRTARRRVERWVTEGAERRGRTERGLGRIRPLLEPFRLTARLDQLAERGAQARMLVEIRIASPKAAGSVDQRVRELPAGGPGVHIGKSTIRAMREAYGDPIDGPGLAWLLFLAEFGESYDWEIDPEEIEDVVWVKLWPTGTGEPRL